jgi:polar amino acid transport system substrate-binding protein
MHLFKRLFLLLCFFLTSCGSFSEKPIRLGVDTSWYPIDFGNQQGDVNAYIEELLQIISRKEDLTFAKINANWDSLFDDLDKGIYKAVISSLTPIPMKEDRYSFSDPLLKIGPVLVLKEEDSATSLKNLSGKTVLIVEGSSSMNVLQQYPDIIVRTTTNIPNALNQVADNSVSGALIDVVFAKSYVKDLYAGNLKIVGEPLTDDALRLITLKGSGFMRTFSKGLKKINEKELEALQAKWSL